MIVNINRPTVQMLQAITVTKVGTFLCFLFIVFMAAACLLNTGLSVYVSCEKHVLSLSDHEKNGHPNIADDQNLFLSD